MPWHDCTRMRSATHPPVFADGDAAGATGATPQHGTTNTLAKRATIQSNMTENHLQTPAKRPYMIWSGLGFALLFPTLLTWAYFVLLAGWPAGVQQAVYSVGKLIQFSFPVVWVFVLFRVKPTWRLPGTKGVGVGLGFGGFVLVAMLLLYSDWLQPAGYLSGLDEQVIQKVKDLGIDSVWKYAATGVFYALAHSLLEEYYWRWFVYGQLQPRTGTSAAILISSLGFMTHHVILLATFFGWSSPMTYLFSLGVAIGGTVWAWLYGWSRSLLGPWLSHLLIDAAIFLIGYDLTRHLLA